MGRKTRVADIDKHIGARIHELRVLSGMSRVQLGGMIGVSYQQLHKYECGMNRVSAALLYELSVIFSVPVACFFERLNDPAPVIERQTAQINHARLFAAIKNPEQRAALQQLTRVLAAA